MKSLPLLQLTTHYAVPIGGMLTSGASLVPLEILRQYGLLENSKPIACERVCFGYRIPQLPNLMQSFDRPEAEDEAKISQILSQQSKLINELSKWQGMAFSLRYLWQPDAGLVEMSLLNRLTASKGRGEAMGQVLANDIATLFESQHLPLHPLTNGEELDKLLQPFGDDSTIVELRQKEDIVKMIIGDAYVVYPFRPPSDTWIPLFRRLTSQTSPCLINIHIEPTQLYPFEHEGFSRAAQLAETMSDYTFEGRRHSQRLVDPLARVVSNLYGDALHRLTKGDPFLMVIQVVSPDPLTAVGSAQALANGLTEQWSLNQSRQGDSILPSGFDLVLPNNPADYEAAWQTLTSMKLHAWANANATPGKERLKYLVDASTAAAGFRFPIPLKGGVPGIQTRQIAPSYETGKITNNIGPDELYLGNRNTGQPVVLPIKELSRHMLIAGTTGSGKTTTSMHLLSQLWQKNIPFLVIEPAKNEYRTLLRSEIGDDLQIFTLGDEGVSPFRLNPLEILPGVRVEAHLAKVRASLEASMPSFGVLPSLIEESLHRVYENKGWTLAERYRRQDSRLMPTIGELYHEIITVTRERQYAPKTEQDILAAAAGRIGSLLRGSKGRMLNTRRSVSLDQFMTQPTVMELGELNDEDKALVMLFLLTAIHEYCQTNRTSSSLKHVTLIEEAHRIMSDYGSVANREVSANTQGQAAGMFSATLSEVRSLGEGIIIAEQIPSRLVQDAIKNTNIKVVHRLLGQDDVESVGSTMNLDPAQAEYITTLPAGQGAVYLNGYERPAFLNFPDYKSQQNLPERVLDTEVADQMGMFWHDKESTLLPFDGCQFCQRVCQFRDRMIRAVYTPESSLTFYKTLQKYQEKQSLADSEAGWMEIVKGCLKATAKIGYGSDPHAAFCYFAHMWEFEMTLNMRKGFWRAMNTLNDD